jgi:hypothetical protein
MQGEQVPSKDLVARLCSRVIGEPGGEPTPAAREYFAEWAGAVNDGWQAADEIERLRKQVDELSIHAEKWVRRALEQQRTPADPAAYYAAMNRLAWAMRNPALQWKEGETIESALIDEAARRLSTPEPNAEIERLRQQLADCNHIIELQAKRLNGGKLPDRGPLAAEPCDALITLSMMIGSEKIAENFGSVASYRKFVLQAISDLENRAGPPPSADDLIRGRGDGG